MYKKIEIRIVKITFAERGGSCGRGQNQRIMKIEISL